MSGDDSVGEVLARLRAEYGPRRRRSDRHPTDGLIATILSQHTADRNSGPAFDALKSRYATWEEIANADPEEVAETIRIAGLARLKTRYIQSALNELGRRYGSMDLNFLRDLPLPEALGLLRTLPGVGPKTAACVLLFWCDLPALPVDTHVHRVSRRLGLIDPDTTAEAAHEVLARLVDAPDVYDFHVHLIAHGRTICGARHPQCDACVLQELCAFANRLEEAS